MILKVFYWFNILMFFVMLTQFALDAIVGRLDFQALGIACLNITVARLIYETE